MQTRIIYIAELDADIDDMIAAKYLHDAGVLNGVVLDPPPSTPAGCSRKSLLESIGICFFTDIPDGTNAVYVGGALTKVAHYIQNNVLPVLVMNGGFVGDNCLPLKPQLKKFLGKKTVRTFNFNCDVDATDKVLSSPNVTKKYLIGKNVCHHERNTPERLWRSYMEGQPAQFQTRTGKLQHDMLACHEGLAITGLIDEKCFCKFEQLYPMNTGLNGNMTKWGSSRIPTNYRPVYAAVDWVDDIETRY